MIEILKFDSGKQDIWLTSDIHWNHNPRWDKPIWEARGFKSIDESNNYAINKINELVSRDSILFNLGDLTLNCSEEQALSFLSRLNCQNIYSLWGNHPNPIKSLYFKEVQKKYGEKIEVYPFRLKNLIVLGDYAEIAIDSQLIVLSHFPFRIWNQQHKKAICLSGHSHLTDKERWPSHPHHKAMDVGWDYKKAPWHYSEIKQIMDKKELVRLDHHNENTN